MDSEAPIVFLSWAHTHRDWSPERTQRWEESIVEFAYLLRHHHVEVIADIFDYTTRGVDWTRYGASVISRPDVTVLIVGNEPYWERWEGRNPPDEGAGVTREADALHGLFDADQRAFQERTLIILLPGEQDKTVPYDLRRVPRYPVDELTPQGIDALLRLLFDDPKYPKEALGQPPASHPVPSTDRPGFGMPAGRRELLARRHRPDTA
ncbi:hypothetical protein OHS58_33525 [Amycolatopsis sp. NBC_00348]|uniref:hypothetical protein n=1 Tax=Amycolatopsis sp. NBC_00348 TaxID=2975956 RepID=UPI002E258151